MSSMPEAHQLLDSWDECKRLGYGPKTPFDNAVDIDLHKDRLMHLANNMHDAIIMSDERALHFLIPEFSKLLEVLRNKLTLELLRNGVKEHA